VREGGTSSDWSRGKVKGAGEGEGEGKGRQAKGRCCNSLPENKSNKRKNQSELSN